MKPRTLGNLLVTIQFAALATLIFLAAQKVLQQPAPAWAWLACWLSVTLGLWALLANRPGNFNIHPTPRADGMLIAHGPYRWIRHPMYTAVMLLGLACVLTRGDVLAWLLWGLLCLVLLAKAVLEERWMMALQPSYAHYRSRTRWFIPYLL